MQINKFLVISQDVTTILEIEKMLQTAPFFNRVLVLSSFEEAINAILDFEPNLILIDTSTFDFSLAQIVSNIVTPHIPIAIISDNSDHAVEAYKLGLFIDFILKPIKLDRLMVAMSRAWNRYFSYSRMAGVNFSFLKVEESYRKFYHDDIVYFEGSGTDVKLCNENGKLIINNSLSQVEEKLNNYNFIRIHKSYVINTKKIVCFSASNFELTVGNVPIGRSYRKRVAGVLRTLAKTRVLD